MKEDVIDVELVDSMGGDLSVVCAARISLASSSNILNDRDEKLIRYLSSHNHLSPYEHCVATFIIRCPLFVRSQIHRHRTMSFNEISRRYTSENISFYFPEHISKQTSRNKQGSSTEVINDDWLQNMKSHT